MMYDGRQCTGNQRFDTKSARANPVTHSKRRPVRLQNFMQSRPFSQCRRYCQLPVSGRRMQRFLQFRLGSHQLPIVLGRFAGGQRVARASRVCTHCGSVAVNICNVADEMHMVFECPALQAVRQQYAPLFSKDTNSMRSLFAQQDHMQVFKFVLDCLDVFQI